jgi:predicted transcriptional regulator
MELSEIKNLRKNAGITQEQLAKLSGVSQAIISRIEAGTVDPAYSSVMKIFKALENIKQSGCAADIMTKSVYAIRSSDKISKAVRIMKTKKISQLPVIDDGKIVGMVSERDISHSLLERKTFVNEIMSEPSPIVNKNAPIELLAYLLDTSPAVIVFNKGSISGLVTRADMMKMIKK